MPAELWRLATELACEHGVYMVSRTLGVSYEQLKKRVPDTLLAVRNRSGPADAPQFVELLTAATRARVAESEWVVELKSIDGTSMTIRSTGQTAPEMSKLVEAFWSRSR